MMIYLSNQVSPYASNISSAPVNVNATSMPKIGVMGKTYSLILLAVIIMKNFGIPSISTVFPTSFIIKMPTDYNDMDGGSGTRTVVSKLKVYLASIPVSSSVVEASGAVDKVIG